MKQTNINRIIFSDEIEDREKMAKAEIQKLIDEWEMNDIQNINGWCNNIKNIYISIYLSLLIFFFFEW